MKRIICLLLCIILLSGCSAAPAEGSAEAGLPQASAEKQPESNTQALTVFICLREPSEEYEAGAGIFAEWAKTHNASVELRTTVAAAAEQEALITEFIADYGENGMFLTELYPGNSLASVARAAEAAGTYWCSIGSAAPDTLPLDYMYYVGHSQPDYSRAAELSAQEALKNGTDGLYAYYSEKNMLAESAESFFSAYGIHLTQTGTIKLPPDAKTVWVSDPDMAAELSGSGASIICGCCETGANALLSGGVSAAVSAEPQKRIAYMLAQCFAVRAGILSLSDLSNKERYFASCVKLMKEPSSQDVISVADWRSFISYGLDF